jgi:hypothetical protein
VCVCVQRSIFTPAAFLAKAEANFNFTGGVLFVFVVFLSVSARTAARVRGCRAGPEVLLPEIGGMVQARQRQASEENMCA